MAVAPLRRTLSSLSVRNFRLYFTGQTISLSGTWMQGVAQAWLVLKLTGSGTALGLVIALQFLPLLFLGPFGGVVTDRFDKRRLLYATQTVAGLLALALGVLVSTGVVSIGMVYALAVALGCVHAIDNPTRQTFVLEMVGPEELSNAVTLNSVMVNLARVAGPAAAGVLIGTVGLAPCFLINAASYLAVLVALVRMHPDELSRGALQPRTSGQLREGLRYVRSTPTLLAPLLMMAVIGTLAYEFQVTLPLLAKFTFDGDAGTYGLMTSFMGGGAVIGGLYAASRRPRSPTALSLLALVFGAVLLAASLAPTLHLELAALVVVGAVSITFIASGNTTLQLAARPEMRGRVMALWSMAFLGSTPVGGPVVGWVGQHIGPRYGLALGGVAALVAGALAYPVLARVGRDGHRPPPSDQAGLEAERPDPEPMIDGAGLSVG
ncbi:MAG: MFS transporter [Actinomycetota bacterium]|nr:MFS transporter [Actinomycetota bacterium]